MLYLTCTMISSVDLARYGASPAKDWVSVDCGTMLLCNFQCRNGVGSETLEQLKTVFFFFFFLVFFFFFFLFYIFFLQILVKILTIIRKCAENKNHITAYIFVELCPFVITQMYPLL